MPEWAQGTDAAELAIAELLGAWDEKSEADKLVAEQLSKNAYGEWIGKMREIVLRPGTPLTQRDGTWKVVSRYEAWYGLGPKLFDEHLDRIREITVTVLREPDSQFDLPPDERYAANIHGKVPTHSHLLRNGLAETLALLGSHPRALTSCSTGKAAATAVLAVRAILDGADWVLWASLDHLLPSLAEAAPTEFLDAVEHGLKTEPCPFDALFAQEGEGFMGRNYMTGLLWALETLAWDPEYLTRVVVILGELATRDPGGTWGNRPANSLSTILLPWLPQTCAPIPKRKTAVATLLNEVPKVGWKLLLTLLPSSHQVSSGSHKPSWREIIPDDWSGTVTHREYWEEVDGYAELAITAAQRELSKLAELIERLDHLPTPARDKVLAHVSSEVVVSMPEQERVRLWNELVDLVSKHRKFADAQWAMNPNVVNEIAAVAEKLAPSAPIYRHQRLFSERDHELYEEKGNYNEQRIRLQERRESAIKEIFAADGTEAVFEFARTVESPWRVGIAFGSFAPDDVDEKILPKFLDSESKSLEQLTSGFLRAKFHKLEWQWIDKIDTSQWSRLQKGQLLAYLPFRPDTWERAAQLLGDDQSTYWSKANANPYETESDLAFAVDRLVEYSRPHEAMMCLEKMLADEKSLDSQQAIRVLQAILDSSEHDRARDPDAIVEIIKALQNDPNANPDDLFQIEWAFLPLLDQQHDVGPKLLDQRLADDPNFFCDVIRIVFRSDKEEATSKTLSEKDKNIATNAYRLLSRWRTPPGMQLDGKFNSGALTNWLEQVKKICAESGHLGSALSRIGHVLVYAPPDPDGLWLHHAAAKALNAKDADDMREGFRVELFNLRGTHTWTAGKEELDLAAKYRAQAEAVESSGYYRLANCLRDLAGSYGRDAEREASTHPHDN
jgi:hypothetical protein